LLYDRRKSAGRPKLRQGSGGQQPTAIRQVGRCSAKGSLISGLSARVAIARAAATMVAVTPTLDARSQLSPSYRIEPEDVIAIEHYLPDLKAVVDLKNADLDAFITGAAGMAIDQR
jgi:hypothetical protein